jgi:pimeloyl-ACP methyl ester carboxylesterase/DNA-binding CsgD family transcriptional regulator
MSKCSYGDKMHTDETSASDRFLRKFKEASSDGDPLEVLVSDTEGFAAALAKSPDDLADVLQYDADNGPSGPVFVNRSAFASAACDKDGRLLLADAEFRRWVMPHDKLSAALAKFDPKRPSISFLVEDRGKFIAVAAAPLLHSKNWPLSDDVKAFLEAGHATIAVIARLDETNASASSQNGIIGALRLTGLEARVCDGLVKAGGTRGAAAFAGVTYETARAELKSAMKKAGVSSQAELVSLLVGLSSGELSAPQLSNVLRDVFNLTERQSKMAIHAANGLDRKEIAQIMSISAHSVKAELSKLFTILNVDTIGNLSRAIAQIKALTSLAGASGIEINTLTHQREPLQLLPRKGRKGRIAFADHGPTDGLPCVILHTATTGRHLPASHVAALQARGLRVIAFDRPGTGLTDMIDGPLLAQTAADMIEMLDALSIERTCLVARGGSMVMAYFARYHEDRFLRGVSLNPEPRPANDTAYLGFVGNVKTLVFNQPKLVAGLAKHLAHRAAAKKVESLIVRALAGSPSDSATLADSDFRAAYVRTTQQSALQSGAGFIAISQYEPNTPDMPLTDGSMMTILYGEDDPVYFHQDGLERWRAMWPNCTVQGVGGAGRLLQFQRPDLIAQALLGDT